MAYPGILTRGEFATGLITRGIKINGNYLLVDSCNINQSQQIDTSEKFLQGGPGSSVSDIGAKKITGDISFPIRVDDNGDLIEDREMSYNLYKMLNNLIKEHKTTLIFTNTRSATERVVDNLKE